MRYSTYFTAAQAGQIATSSSRDTITMPNDVTPLDFGVPVTIKNTTTIGSNPVVIKGGSEDDIIGISIFKQPTEAVLNGTSILYQYKPNEPVGIITDGCIYVIASVDVNTFDTAYIDPDGNFTNLSTDNARFGKFMTRGKAGELVVLEFDIYTYNISNNPIITPSGELILPNHDETYEDTAGEPGELYYRTGDEEVIRAFTGSITDGTWNTVLTSSDPDGYLVVKSSDTDPSPAASGQIYYNTTDKVLKTYLGEVKDNNGQIITPGAWHTIVTDDDDLIALNHTNIPTTPGIIYYNNNLPRTRDYNNNTQTIITTPDPLGNIVVQSHNTDLNVPDIPGLIYYDTQKRAFVGYTDDLPNFTLKYLGPKPTISYSNTTLSDPGAGTMYQTNLPSDKEWTPLYAYDTSSNAGRIIQDHNFHFITDTYSGTRCNGFVYADIGAQIIISTIMVSITGYTTSSNDTTIEFEARNYTGATIPGSRVSMNLANDNRPATVTMIFNRQFSNTEGFNIYVRHTSSNSSIPFYTTNFSASSITF